MRIVHYSHADLSKPVASTEHVMQLAENWARAGHQVTVVTPARGPYPRASRCRFVQVPFVNVRGLREATFEAMALALLVLRALREGIDVFYWRRHGLDPVPALLHLLTGTTVVTEINGLRASYAIERGIRHFRFWDAAAFRPLESLCFHASRWIMPLSETQRDGIVREYPRLAPRLALQRTGLDFDRFRPLDRAQSQARLGLDPGHQHVVWVGYFFPWSGLETLIDAARRVLDRRPTARFVLLGEGHHRAEIERRVRAAKLESHFVFPGFVEKEDLATWYGAATVCVAPYRKDRLGAEGFPPYKVLEYLACGRPVVATRGAGMISWVEEHHLGALVAPEEPAALADALLEFLGDPTQAAAAGARAAEIVRMKIPAWPDVAREVLERVAPSHDRTVAPSLPRTIAPLHPHPRVSVIIPAHDHTREEMLVDLQGQLDLQTYRSFEVLVIRGENRQGRAINLGAARARGEILVTLDDDTGLGHQEVLENLVEALDSHPDVGMVGASTEIPPDASSFVRRAHEEIPRRTFPIVEELIDSDMVQHPCLAIRRQLFFDIGGEDEELIRGLDPILREKVRRAGYRVAIAPRTWIHHLLPPTLAGILRQYYRNGKGSAFAMRHYPERVLELGSGFEGDDFARTRPFGYRVTRRFLTLVEALSTGRWIRALTSLAYSAGWLAERWSAR